MFISEKEFISAYNYLKKNAENKFIEKDFEESVSYIETCAKIGYHLNLFYSDASLEATLKSNAQALNGTSSLVFKPVNKRYVLIDTNGSDNHGLSQQYIRAFINADIEFAYIYIENNHQRAKLIFEEVKLYPKAQILTFEKHYTKADKTKIILEFLKNYRPEKYFMHIMPWDVVSAMVCSLLKNTITYNINATDHAFWLGASFVNYVIEFRDYGYSVSLDKRDLNKNQLLSLPYYPVINRTLFKGWAYPVSSKTIKIFSGGAFYKIYGESEKYFNIISTILKENPNATLFYAGTGDDTLFKSFINNNKLENRICLIGSRPDIYEIFKECDIYLGTYPISGGLMAQYAAVCGKPILAYTDKDISTNFVESIVCHKKYVTITFTEIDKFYAYAKRLCDSVDFRKTEGEKLKDCVISPTQFNAEFQDIFLRNKTSHNLKYIHINYKRLTGIYQEVENLFLQDTQKIIVSKLKFRALFNFPKMFFNMLMRFLLKLKQ